MEEAPRYKLLTLTLLSAYTVRLNHTVTTARAPVVLKIHVTTLTNPKIQFNINQNLGRTSAWFHLGKEREIHLTTLINPFNNFGKLNKIQEEQWQGDNARQWLYVGPKKNIYRASIKKKSKPEISEKNFFRDTRYIKTFEPSLSSISCVLSAICFTVCSMCPCWWGVTILSPTANCYIPRTWILIHTSSASSSISSSLILMQFFFLHMP